jgi:nucleotide-binding universal stress UspA family protein
MRTHEMLSSPVTVGYISGQDPEVIRYALREAARQGRSLRVLQVIEDTDADADADDLGHLGDLTDQLRSVPVQHETRRGDAVTVLLDECENSSCLVVGSDEHAPMLTRRSEVAQHVALHASGPVIVVPGPAPSPAHTSATAILVAVDEAHASAGQLAYAVEIAEQRHAGLEVVFGAGAGSDYPGRMADALRLEDLLDPWRGRHPAVGIHLMVEGGHPVDSCLRASQQASLLVVGRPESRHPALGPRSFASRVLRRAAVPVAVVPVDYAPTGRLEPSVA